jgi:hypothetical protein
MRVPLACLLLLASVAACGSKQEEQAAKPPMKVEDTVFGDMTHTMERAKSVEATTLEHKQAVDRAIEADEGRSP